MAAVDVIYLFIVQRESQASHVGIIESHTDIVCCTSRAELVGNSFTAWVIYCTLIMLCELKRVISAGVNICHLRSWNTVGISSYHVAWQTNVQDVSFSGFQNLTWGHLVEFMDRPMSMQENIPRKNTSIPPSWPWAHDPCVQVVEGSTQLRHTHTH